MSSWDRTRYIPWSRISQVSGGIGQQAGEDDSEKYDTQKERVFRALAREASEEKEQPSTSISSNTGQFVPPEVAEQQQQQSHKIQRFLGLKGIEYSTPDLLRSIAFGGCIGSITGTVFGFMDGMRSAGESNILRNASNMAKAKYLLQGTTRSGATFGVFFGGFHTLKYGIRVLADPGNVAEILSAGIASLGLLMYKPSLRPNIPYAGMLIAMDSFSLYMKEET